jgi:hypothetical protein
LSPEHSPAVHKQLWTGGDTQAALSIPRHESLSTRRIPIQHKWFRRRPISMRLGRYRLGTDSLTLESYRFPNKRHAPAIPRSCHSFIFVALKAPTLVARDRADNLSSRIEITISNGRIVLMMSRAGFRSKPRAWFVRRNDASHLAHHPKQGPSMKPFMTAQIHDSEIHDNKATTSGSFLPGRANIQIMPRSSPVARSSAFALFGFRKALAAIGHKW